MEASGIQRIRDHYAALLAEKRRGRGHIPLEWLHIEELVDKLKLAEKGLEDSCICGERKICAACTALAELRKA